MKLQRITDQPIRHAEDEPQETLLEFYERLGADADRGWATCGQMMVRLLQHLEHEPDVAHSTPQWAHTSHVTLVLDAADDSGTSRVFINAWDGIYTVAYLLEPPGRSSPTASVKGDTADVAEAAQMIHTALKRDSRADHQPWEYAPRSWSASNRARRSLRRITAQQPETLVDYYTRFGQEQRGFLSEKAQLMRQMIAYLEDYRIATALWVYTKDFRLVFTTADAAGPGVAIWPTISSYQITYPLNATDAPWVNAYIQRGTTEMAIAAEMLQCGLTYMFGDDQYVARTRASAAGG